MRNGRTVLGVRHSQANYPRGLTVMCGATHPLHWISSEDKRLWWAHYCEAHRQATLYYLWYKRLSPWALDF
jgi:hypothetical protein